MNASLRDLGRRADAVPAPQLDVADLVAAGESRIRRRRLAAVAAVTAAVLVVVGGALLASPGTRQTAPPPAGPDSTHAPDDTHDDSDVVETRPAGRLLTYAEGRTVHWGDRTIDVGQQAHGRQVGYVDATDDGAVFVIDHALVHDQGGWGMPYGPAAVWFTDGSAPVRIGTTSGSSVRGFGIAPSAEGSSLVWIDPGTKTAPGAVVVYDTAQMRQVARFGNADADPLAVYDDVVYWSPGDDFTSCAVQADFGCLHTRGVMRFDKASGRQSRVNWAAYEADRRSRPGLLTGPSDDGHAHVRGDVDYDSIGFARRADRLVAWSGGVEIPLTVAMTGQPLRLHLPTAYTPSRRYSHGLNLYPLAIAQWLDADRVVLADNDTRDLLVCRLSTGGCRLAVRIPGVHYVAAGPFISHG